MKIDFEGSVRVLDLQHVKLKHAMAIQEYTGLAVMSWTERLTGLDVATLTQADRDAVSALDFSALSPDDIAALQVTARRMPLYTDPKWILSVAAAHWLMLQQAGEQAWVQLDDDYDCDVLGFHLALMTALGEEMKAAQPQDRPAPKAPRDRSAPRSRRTASPAGPVAALPSSPPTGS